MTREQYLEKTEKAKRIVFFGGAGVSTESGIPDFRSVDGLYNQKYDAPPETVLSHGYFFAHPEKFYKFYYDKMIYPDAQPNAAHIKLAEWEKQGKLSAVVTQNIDGLHQAAGSKNVFELHGTVKHNHCTRCGRYMSLEELLKQKPNVPHCSCGGIVKPDVVLYGESLPDRAVEGAIAAIQNADFLIIGGTSLSVYPAAAFVSYFRGGADNVAVINLSQIDGYENQFRGKIGDLL